MVPLFDAYGRPATLNFTGTPSRGLYEPREGDGLRLDRPRLDFDVATLLSQQKHRLLLSDARWIASTFPLVHGAIQQKKDYVCQAGFDPAFTGEDEEWGEIARAALIEAHQVVDIRGPLYPWNHDWQIACTMLDIDGDVFLLHGESPDGYPQIQWIEAHRVGSRYGEQFVTAAGPFSGRRIINGIIYDSFGREIGYRVLGPTAAEDRDYSAAEMEHIAIPRWFSDGRPFPTIAYAILDWYDAKETRAFQRTKQKINSALTIVESTPDGKMPQDALLDALARQRAGAAPTQPATNAASDQRQPLVVSLDGGLIRYIKHGAGDIKSHADPTPADGWLKFLERTEQGAFYGMEWRAEMLDLSKLSGAPTRGFQDQINTTIYARWSALSRFAYRSDMRILAKLIEIGRVPPHAEWLSWEYTPPAEFTVDLGRSNKADLDNVRAGTDSIPSIIARYGRTPTQVLRSQAKYLKLKERIEREEGIRPGSLGTLDQPGLPAPGSTTAPTPIGTAA